MKNLLAFIFFTLIIGGFTSCENDLFEQSEFIGIEADQLGNNGGSSLSSMMGCEIYINGSFEIGSATGGAFATGSVDLWSGAYGTADRLPIFNGILPFTGDFLAHMQRYKGNDKYYETIHSDFLLKEKNIYDLSYSFRGNTLGLQVYTFTNTIVNNLQQVIPSYQNDLGGPNMPLLNISFSNIDEWTHDGINFTNKSGKLLFVPTAENLNNQNRLLLDNVELRCEYGYLDGISATIIQSTQTGYDYQFEAWISETNPDLSYLWTINYLNGGISSIAESPIVNLPYSGKKPYKVEVCLDITDIDGCCVEECIIFEIGEQITPPPMDILCDYKICLDDWFKKCEGADVYIPLEELEEFHCISCDKFPEIFLTNYVNTILENHGYGKATTKLISEDGCANVFVVECSPIQLYDIWYLCLDEEPKSSVKFPFEIEYFIEDCDSDCSNK